MPAFTRDDAGATNGVATMTIPQTAITARRTKPPIEELDQQASLVGRLAMRLRRGSRRECIGHDITDEANHDLLTFARLQIASQAPIEGVDLADPLSITADANARSVRVELTRSTGDDQAEPGLLAEIVGQIASPLFSDGRIGRVEVGLVAGTPPLSQAVDGHGPAAGRPTEWAIAHLGDEPPC